jgi:SAM-dependent methyltransferase
MVYFCLGHRLPLPLSRPLFGDRPRFGLEIQPEDSDWVAWQQGVDVAYYDTLQTGIAHTVNRAGYRIAGRIDLAGRQVLEIGPGNLPHVEFWRSMPEHFTAVDVRPGVLDRASAILSAAGVTHECILLGRDAQGRLPVPDSSIDVIFSFYSLEHLYPLLPYLAEMKRVLRPGGLLVGAIPAEGGLAWGLGRFMTTRRWMKRNTSINPDKIICWEHPNYATTVLSALDSEFDNLRRRLWPARLPWLDINLVASFIYAKRPRSC